MLFQESNIREREENFYKNIIRLYLKYGSVDEVFRRTNYSLPISYPGMHRLIKRWGIVKSAGPNSKLSEALTVLTLLSDNQIPLERLYKKLPPSFKTSLSTLHRIMHNVKEGVIRRYGTALVITTDEDNSKILMGSDMDHGKNITLPMTYSVYQEKPSLSIKRVLQQEVFADLAIQKQFPDKVIPSNPRPFMFLNIADIKVAVYIVQLNKGYFAKSMFSSYKISDHKLITLGEILNAKKGIRAGVQEIIRGYKKYSQNEAELISEISDVNLALLKA